MRTTVETRSDKQAEGETMMSLRDDFYRDGFRLIWLSIALTSGAIALLIIVSLYFFLHQVLPITFPVYEGFRIQGDIPVDKPYLPTANLLQWVSTNVPTLFETDFAHYGQHVKNAERYFTPNGWTQYTSVVNMFLSHDEVMKHQYFITATAEGAPVVVNQGILGEKYAWWVQMPLNVSYSGMIPGEAPYTVKLTIQVLVARVPTLNNLEGIGIDNIIANRST